MVNCATHVRRNANPLANQIQAGDSIRPLINCLPLVYDELRKLAAAKLASEKPGQTLQATALVHEAYLRLLGNDPEKGWDSRGHFFAAAAESMRRILVDRARRYMTQKHGGDLVRVELNENDAKFGAGSNENQRLLDLDAALELLEQREPVKAQLVKLRYFAGLTGVQAAESLGIGVSTADKYWAHAKVWLRAEMIRMANDARMIAVNFGPFRKSLATV